MRSDSIPLLQVVEGRRASQARDTRHALFERCRSAVVQAGEDLAGFALVVWTQDGEMRSSYETSAGPVRPPLVPTLVADALNRHVAIVLAEQRLTGEWKDGDEA